MTEFDHLAPDREHQYVSMGFMLQTLQILPGQLRVLMEADEPIHFAQIVDGCGYFSVHDAERIAERCRDCRKEIHDASMAFERN